MHFSYFVLLRLKVKVILERLMRRLSYEELLQATPAEHHNFIINIHKKLKRAKSGKKNREAAEAGGDYNEVEGEYDGRDDAHRVKGGYEAALYGDEVRNRQA